MALDWTDIIVERDFYSEHYLKSVLEEDLRPVFARWTAAEQDSPTQGVARAAKEWTAAKEQLDDLSDIEARRACQREWLGPLLAALGYGSLPIERWQRLGIDWGQRVYWSGGRISVGAGSARASCA